MPTRRDFLQWTSLGAAASLYADPCFAEDAASAGATTDKKSKVKTISLGVAGYTFHQFPLERAIAMTQRVGLKHFCVHPSQLPIASKPEQIAQAAAKVKAAGLDLYACGVLYMRKPAEVDAAFEYAKAAGIPLIVGMPMPELIAMVNEKVQQYDIRVAIHNHGPGDKVFPTPDIAYEKIKNLDPRLGLCIDIGHTVRAGVDLCKTVEQFADRLFDIHLKDVTTANPAGAAVEVGRGAINIPAFLRTLKQIGFTGNASFEYEKDANDPLSGLAESVGFAKGVLAMI
jgi:sugar phosphate isomerase/epimerase